MLLPVLESFNLTGLGIAWLLLVELILLSWFYFFLDFFEFGKLLIFDTSPASLNQAIKWRIKLKKDNPIQIPIYMYPSFKQGAINPAKRSCTPKNNPKKIITCFKFLFNGLNGYFKLQYSSNPPSVSIIAWIFSYPSYAANSPGVFPFSSFASLSAPLISSLFTALAFPLMTAKWRGESPC